MKVPASIRRVYQDQLETGRLLREKVDDRLKGREGRWHYESRLKDEEAFLLKLESGRFEKPESLEDFFACTLVVENRGSIDRAEKLVRDSFALLYRRPRRNDFTHKQPEAFPFDDLRLYVNWRDDPALPPSGVAGITFEVQIKTFLQHAWSIATHDLTYKTHEAHWGKQRIAYQIKAILEHAEISIQEADMLAESDGLKKTNQRNEGLRKTIALVKELWSDELLPQDVRRLAQNINDLCEACDVDTAALRDILDKERAAGRGPLMLDLSPFGVVVQALLQRRPDQLIRVLSPPLRKQKVVLPSEIELPASVDHATWVNAVFV